MSYQSPRSPEAPRKGGRAGGRRERSGLPEGGLSGTGRAEHASLQGRRCVDAASSHPLTEGRPRAPDQAEPGPRPCHPPPGGRGQAPAGRSGSLT